MADQQTVPTANLVPVTDEARAAIGGRPDVRVTELPFKVGRESRMGRFEKLKEEVERRLGGFAPVNHLYLTEASSHPFHISREHFEIHHLDGQFVLLDRESACGTGVGVSRLGSDRRERRAILRDGDQIVVGAANSPFVFRFQVEG
ncbi:MAG: FHA domain-containing protein [Acidobacteriota bacterium]